MSYNVHFSKSNYNLLLGREWIHVGGSIPSNVHQLLVLWDKEMPVKHLIADELNYKKEDTEIINTGRLLKKLNPQTKFQHNIDE